jgi:AGZA family xanthine/uracil permease-like MFS transporter
LEKFFKLKENRTDVRTEVIGGLATFMTMAYIIQLNPNLLTNFAVGTPLWNAVFLATVLSAFAGTILMAFLANRPFALAPGMGLNSYFAAVVAGIAAAAGLSYEDAFQGGLAIILISGLLFTVLTLLKIREKIVEAIPKSVRLGISAGIGLMLVHIGLTSNAAVYYADGSQTMLGFFSDGAGTSKAAMGDAYGTMILYLLTFFVGLFAIVILNHKKVKGSILYGMGIAAVIYWIGSFLLGSNPFSSLGNASFLPPFGDLFSMTFLRFDFGALFQLGWLTAILTIISFCMVDMFDTIGTLLGTAKKANMLDSKGRLPEMNNAMLADALATCVGACTGTSTVTTFIESAAGVGEGARTGLASLVTGLCFLACIFVAPIAALIPAPATSAALVFVGVLMISSLKEVDYSDLASSVPVVLMLVFMMITSGIGNGIGIGLISYSIIKIFTGKGKEVSVLTIVLSVLFIGKFFIAF